jgi:hypothetical protein
MPNRVISRSHEFFWPAKSVRRFVLAIGRFHFTLMLNHTVEEFSRHNNAFAVDDPVVSKFISNRSIPGRLLDPYLLYRHDQRTVEVRFVNGCQQAVCGTLTAQDLAKSLGLSVCTCTLYHVYIMESYLLTIRSIACC